MTFLLESNNFVQMSKLSDHVNVETEMFLPRLCHNLMTASDFHSLAWCREGSCITVDNQVPYNCGNRDVLAETVTQPYDSK